MRLRALLRATRPTPPHLPTPVPGCSPSQGLAAIDEEKAAAEQQLNELAAEAAHDLGLVLDKTLK